MYLSVGHRNGVFLIELAPDDHLHGGACDGQHLAPGDGHGRALATGEPLGYQSMYLGFID